MLYCLSPFWCTRYIVSTSLYSCRNLLTLNHLKKIFSNESNFHILGEETKEVKDAVEETPEVDDEQDAVLNDEETSDEESEDEEQQDENGKIIKKN